MASYEDDHNLPTTPPPKTTSRSRPNLQTFFSTLDTTTSTTLPSSADGNENPFRLLATAWSGEGGEIMETLVETLLSEAQSGTATKGVPSGFLDGLERVDKRKLKEADICPICNAPFLSDEHPLVVVLPCHPSHAFDLECIEPWLRLHTTCPLDRIDLVKKKTPPLLPDEEEEDYDENYG